MEVDLKSSVSASELNDYKNFLNQKFTISSFSNCCQEGVNFPANEIRDFVLVFEIFQNGDNIFHQPVPIAINIRRIESSGQN